MKTWLLIITIVLGVWFLNKNDEKSVTTVSVPQVQTMVQQPVQTQNVPQVTAPVVVNVQTTPEHVGFWNNIGLILIGLSTAYLLTWPGLLILFIRSGTRASSSVA